MGLLRSIFSGRRRREARREVVRKAREAMNAGRVEEAASLVEAALVEDRESDELLHLASEALAALGGGRIAELFGRAADAPHDPARLFELGSTLLNDERPELAAGILERALAFVPFDAVVRSELALAYARAGAPHRVVETLALHPCLADDPGALFEFAWAALLMGDLEAAEGSLAELRGAAPLRQKLANAIARAKLGMASEPADARDYYFVEHGGLVLDAEGPLAGRYAELEAGPAWRAEIAARLAAFFRPAGPRPLRVTALTESAVPLAEEIARLVDGERVARGKGRIIGGLAVALEASALSEVDLESWRSEEVTWLALTMDFSRRNGRAPDFLGAFARRVTEGGSDDADLAVELAKGRPALEQFIAPRRALLPPRGRRVRSAFVPDAPLPR